MRQWLKLSLAVLLLGSWALTPIPSGASGTRSPGHARGLAGTWSVTVHCSPSCDPDHTVPVVRASVTLAPFAPRANVYSGTITVQKPFLGPREIAVYRDPQDGILVHTPYSALHLVGQGKVLKGHGI